jgi:1-deoxy-D-xylulose-5-phosphate reductoisomerase
MRIPIQYALTTPGRARSAVAPFDLAGRELSFEEPDRATFPALDLAYRAGTQGGSSPAVLNAADEVAVEAFLQGRLGFLGIADVVSSTMDLVAWRPLDSVDEVLEVDREARATAASLIAGAC